MQTNLSLPVLCSLEVIIMRITITAGHVQGSAPPKGTSCLRGHTSCRSNTRQWRLSEPCTVSQQISVNHMHFPCDSLKSFGLGERRMMGGGERRDGWKKRERRGVMFAWHKKSVSTLPTSSTRSDDSSDALVCSINTWPSEREREIERERAV